MPDHAHGPTLAALPCKSKPVVCSAAAEGVVRGAGFTDVTVLRHGDTATLANGALTVTATQGALVGPPWSERECGFVVEVKGEGKESPPIRLYYEPHCDAPAATLATIGTVDVVVTPAASQRLAGYPLVMGDENAVATARALNPAVVVPLTNADFTATGPLAAVIQQVGDEAGLQAKLTAAGLRARVVGAAAPGAGRAIEAGRRGQGQEVAGSGGVVAGSSGDGGAQVRRRRAGEGRVLVEGRGVEAGGGRRRLDFRGRRD